MWSIRSWYERVPRTADEPNRGQANIRKGLKAKSFKIFLKKIIFFVLSIGTRRMNYSEVRTRVGRTPARTEEVPKEDGIRPMYRKSDGRYLDEF